MKKKILIILIIVILLVIGIFIFKKLNYSKDPIQKFGLKTNELYVILNDDSNNSIDRAKELLNNYYYTNERKVPEVKTVAKETYVYYDNNYKKVLQISIIDNNECIIKNFKGKERLYNLKKEKNSNKYEVKRLELNENNGKEEKMASLFQLLKQDEEESFSYDVDTGNIKLKNTPDKSLEVSNVNNIEKTNDSGNKYKDPIWHNLTIFSFDSSSKAQETYNKYIKDLYNECNELNPNQAKTKSFESNNEKYYFIYDNYNSSARGIIGTKDNQMFIFNFLIEDNDSMNKQYTKEYLDLLTKQQYISSNELNTFIISLYEDINNLYNLK